MEKILFAILIVLIIILVIFIYCACVVSSQCNEYEDYHRKSDEDDSTR